MYLSHIIDRKSNTLIVGRQWGRGLTAIDLETGEVQRFDQSTFFTKDEITTTGFRYLALDHQQNIYFTSGKGLGKLNYISGKASIYKNTIHSECTGVTANSEGLIYAVFANDQLYEFDSLLTKVQLDVAGLESILFDQNDQFWATSSSGMVHIDLSSNTTYTLNKSNGLPKSNLLGSKIVKGRSNFIHIYDSGWMANLDKSKLTSLDPFDTSPKITSITPYHYKFSSRNYKPRSMTRFEYMLDGRDENWQVADRQNEVFLSNLTPGKYVFKVRSSFMKGPWNYTESEPFSIPYPWWLRWYSIASVIIFISSLVYIYTHQVRKEEQLKSSLRNLEMQTLRSQMNPHFIFNALNSIKHFILGNDKFEAAEYLSNFSMLIRKILNHSKSESISLHEELETLRLYIDMEKMRFDKQFEYSIEIDPEVDPEFTTIPPLILQPYVENAIWHGLLHKNDHGQLTIRIKNQPNFTIYEIEDNGIGRVQAAQIKTKSALKKKSLGMQITKDRLQASKTKAKVEIEDLEQGTKVTIKIPLV
jgi:hypothetical protein